MLGDSRKKEFENIEDYIDASTGISQTERIAEKWMMIQAERRLERRDEDWTEWFEQKGWESFSRRDFDDEESNKASRDLSRRIEGSGESGEC